jgi:hypothetical protein
MEDCEILCKTDSRPGMVGIYEKFIMLTVKPKENFSMAIPLEVEKS